MKKISVILAGGKGERFWPLTRATQPKQILPLTSMNPMILETYNRLTCFDEFFVVANSILVDSFKSILPSSVHYIIEPEARNTAPAMALACAEIYRIYGDCVIFFETADHYYANPSQYLDDIKAACAFAEKYNHIVAIGITPTEPHTGYGYIQMGNKLEDTFYSIKMFKEKPDRATAQNYILTGQYLWNSGTYASKCSVFLTEMKHHLPNLKKFLENYQKFGSDSSDFSSLFKQTENTSAEFGVFEKSNNISIMKSSMLWEDIGEFNSLKHVLHCDDLGNYFHPNGIKISTLDSNDNIILTKKKMALIGIRNIVVVDTPDVLFICQRSDTQKIKKLLENIEPEYK